VSNSLILLLAFTGARLDPDHDYRVETYAIRHGAERYARDFTVLHREIKAFNQVYDLSLVAKGPADVPLEFACAAPGSARAVIRTLPGARGARAAAPPRQLHERGPAGPAGRVRHDFFGVRFRRGR